MPSQTVRLPGDLASRLERLASTTKRSKTSYIVEALERHLEECEDLEFALSRFRDPNAEWIDHDDVRKELDWCHRSQPHNPLLGP